MTRIPSLIVAVAAFLAVPAAAAEFQIYTAPGFGGASIELRGETPDVSGLGNFHDQAASLIVNDRWEVCTEANYRGECVIVAPGRYPSLNPPIRGRIGSIRPLAIKQAEDRRNYAPPPVAPPPIAREEIRREPPPIAREDIRREPPPRERARPIRGALDIYPEPNYRGRAFRVDRDEPEIDEFIDRIGSLVIHEGNWELCPRSGYRGRCRTLEPGRYPTLRGEVGSLRLER